MVIARAGFVPAAINIQVKLLTICMKIGIVMIALLEKGKVKESDTNMHVFNFFFKKKTCKKKLLKVWFEHTPSYDDHIAPTKNQYI